MAMDDINTADNRWIYRYVAYYFETNIRAPIFAFISPPTQFGFSSIFTINRILQIP